MAGLDPTTFHDSLLQALDVPGRKARLEVLEVMLQCKDYGPASFLLSEEAGLLKKISKKLIEWEKLRREGAG